MRLSKRLYRWWYDHVHSKYYDLLVAWCFLPFGGERAFRQRLIGDVEFKPGDRILEMCCGTGNATQAAALRTGPDSTIIAFDLSFGQTRIAVRKDYDAEVAFLQADATNTPFPDASFGMVMIPHAVHEMWHDVRMRVFREAMRLLKPGGRLVILDLDNPPSLARKLFAGLWLFYWLPFNFETPTRREMFRIGLDNEVREAGFSNVRKLSLHGGTFQVVIAS